LVAALVTVAAAGVALLGLAGPAAARSAMSSSIGPTVIASQIINAPEASAIPMSKHTLGETVTQIQEAESASTARYDQYAAVAANGWHVGSSGVLVIVLVGVSGTQGLSVAANEAAVSFCVGVTSDQPAIDAADPHIPGGHDVVCSGAESNPPEAISWVKDNELGIIETQGALSTPLAAVAATQYNTMHAVVVPKPPAAGVVGGAERASPLRLIGVGGLVLLAIAAVVLLARRRRGEAGVPPNSIGAAAPFKDHAAYRPHFPMSTSAPAPTSVGVTTSASTEQAREQREPGWYPWRDQQRYRRHWDGQRWGAVAEWDGLRWVKLEDSAATA
jgi:hypothetical protein